MGSIKEFLKRYIRLDGALDPDKMIKDMILAIEKEDEKSLLKFMALDKKSFFSKRSLYSFVDSDEATESQVKKLGLLSIGVDHALSALTVDRSAREKHLSMAKQRVLEASKFN